MQSKKIVLKYNDKHEQARWDVTIKIIKCNIYPTFLLWLKIMFETIFSVLLSKPNRSQSSENVVEFTYTTCTVHVKWTQVNEGYLFNINNRMN